MNMKQTVFEYLDKNPQASTDDLQALNPSANRKSLWNYRGQWKKKQGLRASSSLTSLKNKVYSFFDKNPEASMKMLREAFPDAKRVSISNYRYQWKKDYAQQSINPEKKNEQKKKVAIKKKSGSIKEKVFAYIKKHPEISFGELRKALSDINPSSVSAYHSIWKNSEAEGISVVSAGKKISVLAKKEKVVASRKTTLIKSGNDNELLTALKETIEAQKDTIGVMKTQNAMLKKNQSNLFSELEGISISELEEIKKVIAVYVNGLKNM